MKICLIDPPLTRSQCAGRFKRIANILPSLGLGYLAAVLKRDGFDVRIIDCRALNIDKNKLVQMIKEENPALAGITATTLSIHSASSLVQKIKKILPRIYLVLGGPHITAIPKEAMENSEFDIGVIGEGEFTFLKLARQIRERSLKFDSIDGLIYRENGQIKINLQKEYINDLDVLPFPARELYPPLSFYKPVAATYRRLPFAHMMTSRGCPFQCTFCDRKVFGNKFRTRSAENVLAEIEELVHKYSVREVRFFDDTFTIDKKRVILICEGIIKRRLKVIWTCFSHARCVDKELLQQMRRAGCWQIGLGLESGDPKVLASIKKGITLEDSRNAVKWAKQAGMNVRAFFIIGMPGDTAGSIKRTLEFAKSLPIDIANFYNVTLYPGNELFDIAQKEGTLLHRHWDHFCQLDIPDWSNIPYIPKGMTEAEFRKISLVIHKKFYLRPKYIFQQLRQIKSLTDVKRYFDGFLAVTFGI